MPSRRTKNSVSSALPWKHCAKPIESVIVVGAGGTGSIFVTHLCRIHSAWEKLGGAPFGITIYDPDLVTEANLARQVFCHADIGQAKANVLAQRARAFFGIPVSAHVCKYQPPAFRLDTVVVGCVDNLDARRKMRAVTKTSYWLDMGNTTDRGQVVLGGHGLPDFFDLHPEMLKAKDPKDIPSCSMAESLAKQDLFINSTIANLGAHLLWQLMRKGGINHHGYYVNMSTGRTVPIAIA